MKTSLFNYIGYAFNVLFSRRFFTIVGSSLIVSFLSVIATLGGGYVIFRYIRETLMTTTDIETDAILMLIGGFLIFLLILMIVVFLIRGWYAIIIPIRSIDRAESFDIVSDARLYWRHIGTYFGYIMWYSLTWTLIIGLYIIGLILMSALAPLLGGIWAIVGLWALIYLAIRMSVSWYHMLSEGSMSYATWRLALRMTRGRVWRMCYQISGYAIIIWITSGLIESMMMQILALFGVGNIADDIARLMVLYREDLTLMLQSLETYLGENTATLIPMIGWFALWYSVSSVLSRAMFSIFYVRYYLDVREDYHDEHSFIKKSLLIQSSHR